MENTYSLSDIAAASKNNDYDGFTYNAGMSLFCGGCCSGC